MNPKIEIRKKLLSRGQCIVEMVKKSPAMGGYEDAGESTTNAAYMDPEKMQGVEQWLDIQNNTIPDDELPFFDGAVTSIEKITLPNGHCPTSENDIGDNNIQLTELKQMTTIQGSNGTSVELGEPQHSDNQSVSDFSQDDSLRDPDFTPDGDEDDENKDDDSENGNIREEQQMEENTEEIEVDENQEPFEDVGEHIRGRKRIRNEDKWKRNIKKHKINSGQEYISRLGKTHKAKSILLACRASCFFKCTERIDDIDRAELFQKYYQLADKTLQREFLAFTCAYFFIVKNEKIRVCKLFFKSTLNISNFAIDTVLKKRNEYGFLNSEKRGKHTNRANKIDDAMVQGVFNHIHSFPRTESHYCRSTSRREYLEGSPNVSIMYRFYKDQCSKNGNPFVRQNIYQDIFNTTFNLGFFRPKKDACSVCEIYSNLSEEEKIAKKEGIEKHLQEKTLSRLEKNRDKEKASKNETTTLLCSFDLQAVTPLPNGNVSTFYYKSKLNVFNFTIFDIPKKTGFCYMWHEGEAKRGANEIATCIFEYIKKNGIGKKVIFYSDNCSAQNKHKYLMSMYLYAIENLDVERITHKYLIVGHTENEGDSMHSCIEKERSRILKSGPIYVPSEIVAIAKSAKKKGTPYSVTEMSTEDFVDWKKVSEVMGKNYNIDENGDKVSWNEVKVVMMDKENPNKIFYKTSYSTEEYQTIDIRRKTRTQRRKVASIPAYNNPPPIPNNKRNDLISLCDLNLIPKKHHQFF